MPNTKQLNFKTYVRANDLMTKAMAMRHLGITHYHHIDQILYLSNLANVEPHDGYKHRTWTREQIDAAYARWTALQ